VSWRHKHPYISQVLVWQICDCYTDTIREKLTPEEVQREEIIKEVNLTKLLADKCNPKVFPQNPT
jgi:hypothetical protein